MAEVHTSHTDVLTRSSVGIEAARQLMIAGFEPVDQPDFLTKKEQALVDRQRDLAWVDAYEDRLLRQAELEASRSVSQGLTPAQRDLASIRPHETNLLKQVLAEATIPTPRLKQEEK